MTSSTNFTIYEGNDKSYDLTITKTEIKYAQDGAASTITLASTSSDVDDFYNDLTIEITSGTGSGQSTTILDYNGTTKIATVDAWTTVPDETSEYSIASIIIDITGYKIHFTMKERINDTDAEALIRKTIISHTSPTEGQTSIPIERTDTKDVKPGFYPYDIQMDDTVPNRTTLLYGNFTIKQSVGDMEN